MHIINIPLPLGSVSTSDICKMYIILLGVSLTPVVRCHTVYYFHCIMFMFKNTTVTCCLYCHYLGRIKLILILKI